MLTQASGLTADDLADIKGLEQRVIERDGGRLKLEWGVLASRDADQVNDLLWRDPASGAVTGFLGLYSFGGALELAGMVDPVLRRRGIATTLLAAAKRIAADRGFTSALLVTPRATGAGAAFAAAHGGVLEHSEHFLALGAPPAAGPSNERVTLRAATDADRADVGRIQGAAFGHEPHDFAITEGDAERTLVIARDGVAVGAVRLTRLGDLGGVYGFAVTPELQGQGIGRDVLTRVCRQLRAEGATRVTLEVEAMNDHALGLYLSVGFQREATDDYFAVPIR